MTTIREKVLNFIADYKGPHVKAAIVAKATETTEKQVRRVIRDAELQGLATPLRNGFVVVMEKPDRTQHATGWLLKSRHALRELAQPGQKKNTIRDKIWKAMRMRKLFKEGDLVELTDCSAASVHGFVQLLEHHGYLRRCGEENPGGINWQLIKDQGPKRPLLPERYKKKRKAKQ